MNNREKQKLEKELLKTKQNIDQLKSSQISHGTSTLSSFIGHDIFNVMFH